MPLFHATYFVGKILLFYSLFELGVRIKISLAFDSTDMEECLRGFSLSELLRLNHSMNRMIEEGSIQGNLLEYTPVNETIKEVDTPKIKRGVEICETNCIKPIAMALTGQQRYRHGDYHPWQPQPEEKPTKLTVLFNITITALAFLSFGGYLLYLIVHALKSKGSTYLYPVTTQSTTAVDDGTGRIKIYRRGRRAARQQPLEPYYAELSTLLRKNIFL